MLSGGEAWKSTKRTNGVCGWLRSLCSTLGWEVKRMSGWTLWKYVTCACQPSAAGDTFTFLNLHVSAHITLKESIFHVYENKVIFGEGAVPWITNRLSGDEKKNWNTYYANYICCFHFTSGFNQAGWKGSFCKLVNQPVGLERLCSCAQRLNKRLWSVPEFVVVQLSGSQPPTRPEMTQPFREVKIKQRICIPSFGIKFSCFLFFLGSCDICAF